MRGRTYSEIVADKGYFGPSPTFPADPPECVPCLDGECEIHTAETPDTGEWTPRTDVSSGAVAPDDEIPF